jgi:hypothetical protein
MSMRSHTRTPREPISNVVALRSTRPAKPVRTRRPFDWEHDDQTIVAVHLRLTPLELNHALAWLQHDDAPALIREIGTKMHRQISEVDHR